MLSPTVDRSLLLANEKSISNCPTCGRNDIEPFLSAPDRFHGRRKQYELVRCLPAPWCGSTIRPAQMKWQIITDRTMIVRLLRREILRGGGRAGSKQFPNT